MCVPAYFFLPNSPGQGNLFGRVCFALGGQTTRVDTLRRPCRSRGRTASGRTASSRTASSRTAETAVPHAARPPRATGLQLARQAEHVRAGAWQFRRVGVGPRYQLHGLRQVAVCRAL